MKYFKVTLHFNFGQYLVNQFQMNVKAHNKAQALKEAKNSMSYQMRHAYNSATVVLIGGAR